MKSKAVFFSLVELNSLDIKTQEILPSNYVRVILDNDSNNETKKNYYKKYLLNTKIRRYILSL